MPHHKQKSQNHALANITAEGHMMAIIYHYVTLEYIGPATGHQLIPGVTTSCSLWLAYNSFSLTKRSSVWMPVGRFSIPEPETVAALEGYAELLAAFSHTSFRLIP